MKSDVELNYFCDIHSHMLYGCDDGAKDAAEMMAMLDSAYSDGTRILCLTPHYHPGYYGKNGEKTEGAYEKLKSYAEKRYPDMKLCLGNELHYGQDCLSWVKSGECRTLNGTDYLMIDFDFGESEKTIVKAISSILNRGYHPVLAHAERYERLSVRGGLLPMKQDGVVIQIDSQSVLGRLGLGAKRKSRILLREYLADAVASDSHSISGRPPLLSECYELVSKKYGRDYGAYLFRKEGEILLGLGNKAESEVNE